MTGTAAIIGGGVIGGGWAARFLLSGWDVRVFDPDPQAARKLEAVLAGARRALPGLSDGPPPAEGRLELCPTISGAVAGAAWIQESVPERLALKRKVLQTVQEHCPPEAVVASSTSGFKPSELQGCAARPGQVVVAHPFNPVYLLPLVELVTTDRNPSDLVATAIATLSGIGMQPLHLRREIDAHIADRLLEAVWREALWLVKDGVATTAEIDDAIRLGFGLRWAQMGLFETYRIAGGEAGMRHFIAQFGPCLEWPWSRLTDVPDLTPDLVDRIATQSDAQSGAYSIRDLERIRDTNLVAFLRSLKARGWGAGAALAARDAPRLDGPLRRAIPLDWLDDAGRMQPVRLAEIFAEAADRLLSPVAAGGAGRFVVAETRITQDEDAFEGQILSIRTICTATDPVSLSHVLYADGSPIAHCAHRLNHVARDSRAVLPLAPAQVSELLQMGTAP